ncbi:MULTISPECIES: Na/Pi cotransporter family protein [Hungatella]|uniref:Na/Pi cotransporter family protein n=1 Tax=Hungatella hathewayi TaxID=154046 RepID=A0AAW9WN94_9FIRM|nr:MULTISPECIES: Na/Pi cotransporter family protein [Hungatella]MCQ4831007.1 Na/Pi cotransporter family protein [Hungatella sp. SL.1.14]MUB66565.1 Na/Pi cotransporter family protein [Hungatella hathewayi]CUQ53233.1 Na/Pi-cotransporter II-like protein [Hungatella hathewayi]
MSVNDISSLFSFIGGLGMFLYGMNIMADGMQKTAGSKMSQFLGMLTNNRLMAVLLGALITAIIQSSGATTVMVVGFVSAGVLNLTQAVGVIMGANIGTTITAWIVSMNQLGDAFAVFQPAFFAPLLIGIGAIFMLFGKKQKMKTAGEILVGLGLLFIGLDFMSSSISPYTDAPVFSEAFRLLGSNPILGMLIGALVTALLQSSSASVGILQTLAMNGVVTTNAAIFITLGQNIGSCVTAMISSIGGSRTAKRAAVIHLTFNMMGAVIFGVISFVLFSLYPLLAAHNITSVQISIFHTIFNLTNTALLFPFANQLVKLSGIFVPEDKKEPIATDEESETMKHLDERIFESPAFALETAAMEVVHMGQITMENVRRAMDAVLTKNADEVEDVYKTEQTINNMEKMLTEYLVKVNNLSLTERQKLIVNDLFYSINDIERVGDHAENLAEQAEYMVQHNISFSETGESDLHIICETAFKSFQHSIEARRKGDMDDVRKVSQYEDEVDTLEEELREKHIERLSAGKCDPSAGVVFLDLISNLERISDHAYNLAGYVKDEM